MFLSRISSVFLLCLFSTIFLTYSGLASAKSKQDLFSVQNIQVPFSISQPILPVNLLDTPGVELLVIGIDKQKTRWLAIYSTDKQTGKTTLLEKQQIPNKFFGYDISPSDDKDKNKKIQKLYFIAQDEVALYQIKNNSDDEHESKTSVNSPFIKYQSIDSMYLVKEVAFLARRDFIKDINHDGKDDIVLQDFEQLNVWLSNCCQALHFLKLPLKAQVSLNDNVVTFKQSKLYFVDVNLDLLEDVTWVSNGKIEYFPQLSNGLFDEQSQTIVLADNISDKNWWNIREADGDNLDQSKLSHRVVEQIKDVNGDGLADVVVKFTQSSGVLDKTNDYEFYFGRKEKNQQFIEKLTFPLKANSTIKADGTLTGLTIVDTNNDSRFEVMLSSFELSLTNIIGALISGSIDQDVLLFSLDSQQKFSQTPVTSKEVELSFSLSKGRSGNPVVILLDVNGDGLQDLLLSDEQETLKLYLGKNNNKLFNKKALKQEVFLPQDGNNVQKTDLNGDGKDDLVMHYGRLDENNMHNKLTLLLSK